MTLLDTLRKRTDFVTQAAARSGLHNTRALWARAEDAAQQPEHRQVRVCVCVCAQRGLCLT